MDQKDTDAAGKHRKQTLAIILAVIMALILIMTYAGISGSKGSGEDAGNVSYAEETAKKTQDAIEDAFPDLTASSGTADKLTKDETVYVIMDADGNEQERVVNAWLKNPEKLDSIKDWSRLKNIQNTSGEETFTKDGKHLTWAANGSDIKYSGTTKKDLPVYVEISYYLDGEYVSASEIAGRSGDVEIHFDYGVNARDRIVSDGSGYDLTHPYVMASGLLLDTDLFSDIEVSSGRVINEAGQAVCLGIALPGIQEDLALSHDLIDIPESVVIKAKTSGFKINGTYTVALTGLLKDIDTGKDDVTGKLGELESAIDKLNKASSDLVKGSRKVADGAEQLAEGAYELADGTDTLEDGTSSLKKGGSALSSGLSKLEKGSGQLSSGTSKVRSGAEKAEKGAKDLTDGLSEISSHSEELNDATDRLEKNVFDNATQLLQANLIDAGMSEEDAKLFTLEPETYEFVFDLLIEEAPEHTEEFQAAKEKLDAMEEYIEGIKSYTSAVDEAADGAGELSSKMGDLTSGAKSVEKGADNIYDGLSEISDKMPQLNKGIKKIVNGADKLDSGADKLASGSGKLAAGSDELADGMAKFDKDGIKKLVNSLDKTGIATTLDRVGAIAKASGRSHFVGGTPKKIAGETRIIFKTGAVE